MTTGEQKNNRDLAGRLGINMKMSIMLICSGGFFISGDYKYADKAWERRPSE